MSGLTVVLQSPPTPNGPLHVGHLSGPYLAADVVTRAARLRGESVLAVAGLDVHQNFVPVRARQLGVTPGELVETSRHRILNAHGRARIGWDTFLDPTRDAAYAPAIAGLAAELVRAGVLPLCELDLHRCARCAGTLHHATVTGTCPGCGSESSGGSCEGCGGFTSAQTLLDPRCARCGAEPVPFRATVPVLRMADFLDQLLPVWTRASLPQRLRTLLGRHLAEGLPTVPVAYPTDWGIEGTGPLAGLRLDVYFELALSVLYGVARAVEPAATGSLAGAAAAWAAVDGYWHVHGIDNAFYFGLQISVVLAAAGIAAPPLAGVVANEFLRLDGKKFSTSRDHAIWVDDLLAGEDPALVRLFLCWCRPDRSETDFTLAGWTAFRDWAGPLLNGAPPSGSPGTPAGIPAVLHPAELDRAEDALRPDGFDPALAARAVLGVLAAGGDCPRARLLLGALTGTEGGPDTTGRPGLALAGRPASSTGARP